MDNNNPKIFISHATLDSKFVNEFMSFLCEVGIPKEDIFCSSFEGNGVKNGERIPDSVINGLKHSDLIIYFITNNFLKSTFCTQELGAFALLDNSDKSRFIFKFDDVDNSEIKGFVDSSIKYNLFDSVGLSNLYDSLNEIFNLNKKISQVTESINKLLANSKSFVSSIIEDKNKTNEELNRQHINNLRNSYHNLSQREKLVIAEIYFGNMGIQYYSMSDGVVGLLESKHYIFRTTAISNINFYDPYTFAYALQTWVIDFIKENKKVYKELEGIYKLCHKER